jgi:hypothetical protein
MPIPAPNGLPRVPGASLPPGIGGVLREAQRRTDARRDIPVLAPKKRKNVPAGVIDGKERRQPFYDVDGAPMTVVDADT